MKQPPSSHMVRNPQSLCTLVCVCMFAVLVRRRRSSTHAGALQVLLTMHANLLDRLPFLNNKHPQFLEQLIPQLKLEYYSSGEYVIWQGDHSTDMYFVAEGLLEVRVTVDEPATTSPRCACSLTAACSFTAACFRSIPSQASNHPSCRWPCRSISMYSASGQEHLRLNCSELHLSCTDEAQCIASVVPSRFTSPSP